MKQIIAIAFPLLGTAPIMAVEPEFSDRIDPLLDCSTPILDTDTPERAKSLRVQAGGDALAHDLRETYAARLAGLFWDQREGLESRLGAPLRIEMKTSKITPQYSNPTRQPE